MSVGFEPWEPLAELAGGVRRGERKAVELLDVALERIAATNDEQPGFWSAYASALAEGVDMMMVAAGAAIVVGAAVVAAFGTPVAATAAVIGGLLAVGGIAMNTMFAAAEFEAYAKHPPRGADWLGLVGVGVLNMTPLGPAVERALKRKLAGGKFTTTEAAQRAATVLAA